MRVIAAAGFWSGSMVWSRDGRRLYFTGQSGDKPVGSSQLWVVETDGSSGPECMSKEAILLLCRRHTRQRPDELLAMIANGVESEFHRIDPSTHERTVVSHIAGDVNGLSVSDEVGRRASPAPQPG